MSLLENAGFVYPLVLLIIVGLGIRVLFTSDLFVIIIGWQGLKSLAPAYCCRASCGVGHHWGRKRF